MRLITTYSAVSTGDGLYSPAGRAAAVALASMQLGDGHKIRSNTSMAMEGMHNLNSPELWPIINPSRLPNLRNLAD